MNSTFTVVSSGGSVSTSNSSNNVTLTGTGTITKLTIKFSAQVRVSKFVVFYSPATAANVDSVSVTPTSNSLYEGETLELTASVSPVNASQAVTWSSENDDIATVDSTGKVTAISAGTTTIKATSQTDATKFGVCEVTVNELIETYPKIKDPATLESGDKVIIVATDYDAALSTTQNTNNRGEAGISKSGQVLISYESDTQVLTLEEGTVAGTFAFNTGAGYLTSASNSGNYLRTVSTKNDNASWEITIENGVATIVSQGNYERNCLQYNQSSSIFACYASASQKSVSIYLIQKGSSLIETKVSAVFNDGKGNYYRSNNNNLFSTSDLLVQTLTSDDVVVNAYSSGTGFKVTIDGAVLDATSSVETYDLSSKTAGTYQLTVNVEGVGSTVIDYNVYDKDVNVLEWNHIQTTSYVSYIDSFTVDATFSAKFNDGSTKVSDLNIVTNIYSGDSNSGELVGTTTKGYNSYSNGFNLTDEMGISVDDSIHNRLAYATAQTFYLEFYLENYPTKKLGTVVNITMPELEVEDAIDTNYYIGSSYDTVANAKLVSGTKERVLNEDEFTLNPSEITPSDENPITVTATFNDCQTLTDTYVINPVQPATIDSVEIYDENGDYILENDIVYFKAGDEFKLYENNASAGVIFTALDTDTNILEYTDYSDITFVLADDADGTNKTNLEPGETVYLGMDEKFVILTYVNGEQEIKFSYQLTVEEATVIEYKAPVTGGQISKTTEISVGDIVYLVCEEANMEFSAISTTSTKYGLGVELTTNGVASLIVCEGKISGTFAFKFGDSYLTWTSGNSLDKDSTISESTSWYVSFDASGNAIIENYQNETDRRIGWNNSSPRFANYKDTTLLKEDLVTYNTNYYAVQLYKASGSTAGNGVDYLKSVIDTFRLNSNVSNKYGLSICNKDSGIYSYENWDLVKEIYEGLDNAELQLLDVQDKYAADKITYNETFEMLIAADSETLPLNLPFMNLVSEESNVSILIIAVAIGMVGVLTFVSIRKRRENRQ